MIRHRVNVPGNHRVAGITEKRPGLGPLLLEMGIPPEGIGNLDRLPAVRRVVDIHRHRPAQHVTVVSPHEHFRAINVPGVDAVERMEIPAGLIPLLRRVREVIAALAILDNDLPVRLEIVGAQEQLFAVVAKRMFPFFRRQLKVGPPRRQTRRCEPRSDHCPPTEKASPRRIRRPMVPLRIDVGPLRREAIPEVVRFTCRGDGPRSLEMLGPSKPPTVATAVAVPMNRRRLRVGCGSVGLMRLLL